MYKKILKAMVQKFTVDFIQNNFDKVKEALPGSSKKIKLKISDNGYVKFECEVIGDEGEKVELEDKDIKIYNHYQVRGIVHDSGKISIMNIHKAYVGDVATYNSDTHELEFLK